MKEILEHVQKEWEVVSSAPFTILITIALIYGAHSFMFKARLEKAKDVIKLQKEQLELVKNKTGTSSIGDAIERLESLEQINEERKLKHAKI